MSDFRAGDVVKLLPGSNRYPDLTDKQLVVERVEEDECLTFGPDLQHMVETEFEHVTAPVGMLARWDGKSWQPVEEPATQPDDGWYDVTDGVRNKPVNSAIREADALGLQVRVQARRVQL